VAYSKYNCGHVTVVGFSDYKACEEIESVICDVYMAIDAQTDGDDDGGGGGDVNVGVCVFVCLDDAEATDRQRETRGQAHSAVQ